MGRPLLAAILILALDTAHAAEWVVEGLVVGVSDGDTITVTGRLKDPTQDPLRGDRCSGAETARTATDPDSA